MSTPYLLPGEAARRIGPHVQSWQVTRVFQRGLMPETRIGRTRVVHEDQLPLLRDALIRAGFFRSDEPEATHAAS